MPRRGTAVKRSLTKKQEALALHFARTDNPTESVKAAGYKGESLRRPGTLLTQAVMERVAHHRKRLAGLVDIREVSLMRELGRIGMARLPDVMEYMTVVNGKPDFGNMPDDLRAVIKRVRVRPTKFGDEMDVELHDKLGAIRLLAQIKSMMESVKTPPRIEYNTTVVAQNAQVNNGPSAKRLPAN